MLLAKVKYSLILIGLFSGKVFSQNEKVSEGLAEIKLEANATIEQTKQKAINAAKINAIESAFGSVVLEGNSLYTVNKQEGTKLEFNQIFNSISDVFVNGDWIKDIEKPIVERHLKGDDIFYTAKVKGLIRELKNIPVSFTAKALSCEKKSCETEIFNNGQDFYLFFKAPNDGYLSVYIDIPIEHTTFRLLPYKQDANLGSVFVKADEEYVFFSPAKADVKSKAHVDELVLSLSNPSVPENNKLFVMFRPAVPIEKPVLSKTKPEISNAKNLEMPLHLKSEDFQLWMQQLRARNNDIQLFSTYITVKPN
jgi:hypothetical protein